MIGEKISKRRNLFIAVSLLFLFYILDGTLLENEGYIFEMVHSVNNFGTASFIVPVACSLPGVLSFFSDKEDCAYRYKVIRSGRVNYTLRIILGAMFYGACVVLLSLVLLTATFLLMSKIQGYEVSFMDCSGIYGVEGSGTIYLHLFDAGCGWLVLLLNYLMMILNGAIWPCFGIAVSAIVKNKKIAVVSPFLLYRIFAYIYDFMEYLTPLSFDMTLGIVYEPWGGFLRVFIYMLVVLILSALILWGNLLYRYERGD